MLKQPGKLLQGVGYRWQTRKSPMYFGTWVKKAEGDEKVQQVTLSNGKKEWTLETDILAVGYHLIANTELARIIGCELDDKNIAVDDIQQTSVDGVFCAGEGAGIGGVDTSLIEGQIAALAATGDEAAALALSQKNKGRHEFRRQLAEVTKVRAQVHSLATDNTCFCRCEDVPYSQVKDEASQKAAKLYTRCGMGPCQGRVCSAAGRERFSGQLNRMKGPLIPLPLEEMIAYTEILKNKG
ncbi:MAG: FAD-dependent oxidoreductase [Lentisphaeraceae bacterium]|nr:FAD-dependent oxidoreductase [Lentisphaeraceae bacterium]